MRRAGSSANTPPWRARSRASNCQNTPASAIAGTKVAATGWRRAGEDDAAAPHAVAHVRARAATDRDRAGHLPRCEEVADIAEHDRAAAPHAVAEARAGVAAHDQRAAAHAVQAAGQRCGGEVADVALDMEFTTGHLARREQTGTALDVQAPAAHRAAGVVADAAVDDDLARRHLPADAVEARQIGLEVQRAGGTRRDAEELAEGQRGVAVTHAQLFHLRRRQRCQRGRRHAAQVHAQRGCLTQREVPAVHGAPSPSSLCRWKWNGPSLPP